MGVSEVVLIIISIILAVAFIAILLIANKHKKADEKKAKEEENKASATTATPKIDQPSQDGIARTINLNKIIGKSKEEVDNYFNNVISAKTSSEIEKINSDTSLVGIVKVEEVGEIDEFTTFDNDESFFIEEEYEVTTERIQIGKKNPAYGQKNNIKDTGLRQEFNNMSKEMKALVISGLDKENIVDKQT